ncbi:PilZ domain-containing protein [Desulfomicrobium escambiense]|uniref:PilZ domain-containing protein n=1 Tax=Desulfomicrobium escambiense TaxID=29503 RepID=UPI0004096E3A|nr:PilZ domain-containing protein [Desulfomicrobium escambiense]
MPEKRKSQRTACLEECLVRRYPVDSASCRSRILNYSQSGIKIETECPLRNDEHIKICGLGIASDAMVAGLGQRVGKVRWCSAGPPPDTGLYEAGVTVIGGVSENTDRRNSSK